MNPKVPTNFSILPPQASTVASQVDNLYFFQLSISLFFIVTIGFAVNLFLRKVPAPLSPDERPGRIPTSKTLEITWTVIPFLLVLLMFFWGTKVFFQQRAIPDNAMEIQATGKKWMWKFQHLNGRREINDLHVPIGVPIKLKMASEDVIHDVSIPAFRIKQGRDARALHLRMVFRRPRLANIICSATSIAELTTAE